MKVSDYIISFLEEKGVKDVFTISGGGMMHLLDSLARSNNIKTYCNLNEQATSICAESYGQISRDIGVCFVTTGPGGTNAITGVSAAWLDSTPLMVISGQVKTNDFASKRGVRQYGAQEVDIVSMVKSTTKYAVTITNKNDVKYHLQKAFYEAQNGRKGPVWLDIPLDIQSSEINILELKEFCPKVSKDYEDTSDLEKKVDKVINLLNKSEKPLILVGGGLACSCSESKFLKLIDRVHIPVVSSWRIKGLFGDDDEDYYGHPGIPGHRYANYILQSCDFLLILGTRLNPGLTAYDEKNFARNAKKIILDIDENEISKLDISFDLKINKNIFDFLDIMISKADDIKLSGLNKNWKNYCNEMKRKYSIYNEKQVFDQQNKVDAYKVAQEISNYLKKEDVVIGASSGRSCGISHMAIKMKKNQNFISSLGLGSMGFTIPSAIACCIAKDKARTVAFEGDGSLQHNIQELELIKDYNLPIKLFIISNSGYASIYTMQKNNFNQKYLGCLVDEELKLPLIKKVAELYELTYLHIKSDNEINDIVKKVFESEGPVLCEVDVSVDFDEIPKSLTLIDEKGIITSSSLENLYPFLDESETLENIEKGHCK